MYVCLYMYVAMFVAQKGQPGVVLSIKIYVCTVKIDMKYVIVP